MTEIVDIQFHKQHGAWRVLEQYAQKISAVARERGGDFFAPVLGGGTRLMLALEHRISDDIGLFVDSPAWLPYVSPRTNDQFEEVLSSYNEDSGHVKWKFVEGEIDFIVSTPLLPDKAELWNPPSTETSFELEPPYEVLAKKLFYHGWALTPRDLFDWMHIEEHVPVTDEARIKLAMLLKERMHDIRSSLHLLNRKKLTQQAWARIKAPEVPQLSTAIAWGHQQLENYQLLLQNAEK